MECQNYNDSKRDLVNVANAMLVGEMHLIEGVRKICSLRFDVGAPDNEVFITIRGIDSETDCFPLGDVRINWAFESLAKVDKEMEKYLLENRNDILQSCREIVNRYSNHEAKIY